MVAPEYAAGVTAAPKRKISVSLDADLVAELEASGEAVSKQLNDALRALLVRRRRQRLLEQWLDELDGEHGPVSEALVARYEELLGS